MVPAPPTLCQHTRVPKSIRQFPVKQLFKNIPATVSKIQQLLCDLTPWMPPDQAEDDAAAQKIPAIMIEINLPANQSLNTYCQRSRILANIRHQLETAPENPRQ
jgi:hypothetical protein